MSPHSSFNLGLTTLVNPATQKQSSLWPSHYDGEFIKPVIPQALFLMRYNDDDTDIDGPFDGTGFNIDPETNIAFSRNGGGHPITLRVIKQVGTRITCINGDGSEYVVDMISPVPGLNDGTEAVETDAVEEEGAL